MSDVLVEWRDIDEYKGLYQISNSGQVKNLRFNRILTPGLTKKGYPRVSLCREGKMKKHVIHRLLAKAFIPNPNNYCCINHKNGIKADYSLSNLEWCNPAQNVHHAIRTGLWVPGNRKNAKRVINMCTGQIYATIREAADNMKLNYKYCSRALNRNKRSYKCLKFAA